MSKSLLGLLSLLASSAVVANVSDAVCMDATGGPMGETLAGYTSEVACGAGAKAEGMHSVAIGKNSHTLTNAVNSVAIGLNTTVEGMNAVAIGPAAEVSKAGLNGIALGNKAIVTAEQAIGIGLMATGSAPGAVAMGTRAQARGEKSLALGVDTVASGFIGVAVGDQAKATGDFSVAMGADSLAAGMASTAIGQNAKSSHDFAVAIGSGSIADGASTAIGQNAHAQSTDGQGWATAIGNSSHANKLGSLAVGVSAKALGEHSVGIGSDASASAETAVALGHNAQATTAHSIALGANAQTGLIQGTATHQINAQSYAFAGATPVGTLSIGSIGAERTITHVAAGRINAHSTDAVNGSQLHATHLAIEALDTKVEQLNLGHQWSLETNGEPVSIDADGTLSVNGDRNNILVTHSKDEQGVDNIQVSIVDDPKFKHLSSQTVTATQMHAGNNTLVVSEGSIQVKEGTQINMGGNVVHNVAAGVKGTDAVNVDQLNMVKAGIQKVRDDIKQHQDQANAGTAAAMAVASLGQAYAPGQNSISVAGGVWRGKTGYALGVSTLNDDGNWLLKASVTSSEKGGFGGGASATYIWQ